MPALREAALFMKESVPMIMKKRSSVLLITFLAAFVASCQTYEHRPAEEPPRVLKVERMVVFGFRSLPSSAQEGETVRSPLTGSMFIGGSVPPGIYQELTDLVYKRLSKESSLDLVPPEEARKALWTLKGTWYEADEKEVLRKTGESLASDAVLAGHVFRWRERVGTNYAVSRPASVALELSLLRVADGSIIWKGRFDKTQASLSENILDLNTFLKGKGRWMTVHELAAAGVSDLLDQFPIEKRN
jgi:hypothetical protein